MSGETNFTPGPWYVRDLRASEMRLLGWTGPSIDRILITNKTGDEIIRDEGEDCIVARIQFDQRPEELREGNLADAILIAAAPRLYWALFKLARAADACAPQYEDIPGDVQARVNEAYEALARARGEP